MWPYLALNFFCLIFLCVIYQRSQLSLYHLLLCEKECLNKQQETTTLNTREIGLKIVAVSFILCGLEFLCDTWEYTEIIVLEKFLFSDVALFKLEY